MRNVCKAALCLILVIFFLPLYGAAQTEPTLVMPVQVPADAGATVTMPVTYIANGNVISSMIFSVDFDENNLIFDPASTMGFPWPDAITINPLISPFVFSIGITYDAADTDGELDFTFSDINLPLSALPEGELVSITFTAGNPATDTNAPVRFSLDPTASFGNTDGASVPGVTVDGSVSITTICTPTDTVDTTCDGIDDDCDGSIDEDYVPRPVICDPGPCISATEMCQCINGIEECPICIPAPPVPEVCDNLDNDCDGLIDEDLTRPTTCGVGECVAIGEETCTAGMWGGDTCTPGTPSFEVCDCFFLDEDCDGLVDEICACICDEIRSCGSDVGECLTGAETCVGGDWSGVCVGEVGPSAEVCDNLDNDCDGTTDEDLARPTTCGVGECAGNTGEETCTAGMWGSDTCDPFAGAVPEGPPGDPVCGDTLDNDCDGQTDEGDPDCGVIGGGETNCFDGIDNNGDGLTDCEDPGCDGVSNGACSTANACTTGTRTCQGGAEVCVHFNVPDGTACGDPSSTQCDNPDSCLAGACAPNFEPSTTPCDDRLFCRGGDTCNGAGACAGDTSPCPPELYCDEVNDVCVPLCSCITDDDCGDGLFCNGPELCDGCLCYAGPNPCQPGEVCDENQNTCSEASLDLDIVKFTVSGSKDKRNKGKTKTGGSANVGKPIRRIQLVVENPDGGSEQGASSTITGMQDGKEVYSETRMVWDLGTGKARFAFPNYTPVKKGTIQWTAEIFDNDPDNDTATATTRVK